MALFTLTLSASGLNLPGAPDWRFSTVGDIVNWTQPTAGRVGSFKIKTSQGDVVATCEGPNRLYVSTSGVGVIRDPRCI
jgi:hypothetical protein